MDTFRDIVVGIDQEAGSPFRSMERARDDMKLDVALRVVGGHGAVRKWAVPWLRSARSDLRKSTSNHVRRILPGINAVAGNRLIAFCGRNRTEADPRIAPSWTRLTHSASSIFSASMDLFSIRRCGFKKSSRRLHWRIDNDFWLQASNSAVQRLTHWYSIQN